MKKKIEKSLIFIQVLFLSINGFFFFFSVAIEACRKELSGTTTSEQCSEQTTSVCGGPVFEEFIPIKKSSLCEEEEEDGVHESPQPEKQIGNKKLDWLRSVQLWNPSPDPKEVSNFGLIRVNRF